jgi:hypothetical protein
LIETDCLDTDLARRSKLPDGQGLNGLTLYHGTEAIWRFAHFGATKKETSK